MRLRDTDRDGGETPGERELRELAVIDAALRGEPVDAAHASLAEMARDLRDLRDEPDPAFAAALDEWAAAGFPRDEKPRSQPEAPREPRRLLPEWLSPRNPLVRRGFAVACVTLVIGGTVVGLASLENFGGDDEDVAMTADMAQPEEATTDSAATTSEGPAERFDESTAPAPEAAAPTAGAAALGSESDGVVEYSFNGSEETAKDVGAEAQTDGSVGTYARAEDDRQVARDAQLELATESDKVAGVAGQVMDVTESYGGIVMSSQVTGTTGDSRATLRLAIPSKNLNVALADLSDLAEVRSRSEQTDDITRPYVSAEEELNGLKAQRQSVLEQLAAADTAEEEAVLTVRLNDLDNQVADARAEFEDLARNARMADVDVRIVTADPSANDGWTLDEAADDAGEVITTVAGILLVAAAVIVPLALIALIAWFAWSKLRQRSRERALDD